MINNDAIFNSLVLSGSHLQFAALKTKGNELKGYFQTIC